MFHRHEIEIYAPLPLSRTTDERWYVSEEEYQEAVRRGMRLRSEAFAAALRTVGRWLAGLFGTQAASAPAAVAADNIRRHADGAIDIEHYEALARRARAEAAGEFIDAAGRWLRAATGR
jgi:hypothetical protein